MDKICIKDVAINIENDSLMIKRKEPLFSLSNSNNGFNDVKTIINHSIDFNISQNKEKYKKKFLKANNISDPALVMFTDANIDQIAIETSDNVTAIVSASNNHLFGAGEFINKNLGSINIILLINRKLSYKSLLDCYTRAIESKIASLWDLDVRSPSWDLSVGNFNDSLIVACTGKAKEEIEDEEELQNLVSKCIRKATKRALLNNNFSKDIIKFIEGIGINIEDLVEAGMELVVGVEKSEELYEKLHKQILKSLEDLNVVSFIIAGIRLEEDFIKHRVAGINVDDDPAYLYSDEVFGMSIANQIAGTKAIFNFKRYDEEKPGIISELGPVLDDIFAGLIAGCMSKIFEE